MKLNRDKKHILDFKIPHRNWLKARNLVFSKIINSEPKDVLLITGPSRIGKSKLADEIFKEFSEGNDFNITKKIPVISIMASNSANNGAFSTKDFYYKLNKLLKNPLFSESSTDFEVLDLIKTRSSMTEHALRSAVVEYLISRETLILIIDEAQHVKFSPKSQASHSVLDSWKCLAEETGIILIIIGAYPILDIIRKTPHLLGRSQKIIMDRYKANKEDVTEYSKIINAYCNKLNISDDIKGTKELYKMLFDRTLGCIGILKVWLKSAHTLSEIENTPIDFRILEETMQFDSDIEALAQEITDGEKLLINSYVVPKVNKKVAKKKTVKEEESIDSSPIPDEQKDNTVRPKQKQKPFKRKPKRFTGGNLDD